MTTLYYFYGEGHDLLYIGIADRLTARLCQHERRSPWFPDVRMIKVAHYATRERAHLVEQADIARLNPRHNILRYDRLTTSLTLPKRLTRAVSEYAVANCINKSRAAEDLIERGLETVEAETQDKVPA